MAKRNRAYRERAAADLKRRKGKRPPHERILIVSEGSKTEPNYFTEIRRERRLSSLHVKIVPADGTQPLKVVGSAEKLFSDSREYERVYAVFDRDSHDLGNYRNALAKAVALDGKLKNTEGAKIQFKAIPSVPCFEYWILLHFENVQHFLERDVVYRRVRQHLPGYEKGNEDTYAITKDLIPAATERAIQLRRQYSADNGGEPYTDADELVAFLRNLS